LTGISAGAEMAEQPVKVEQAAAKIAAGNQLLDVRTKEEWKEGHLKGAKLLPLPQEGFAAKTKTLLDPKKPVVVYCHRGFRSAKAAKFLREGGFHWRSTWPVASRPGRSKKAGGEVGPVGFEPTTKGL
jgi:rhodanese-related sulfurtransferase